MSKPVKKTVTEAQWKRFTKRMDKCCESHDGCDYCLVCDPAEYFRCQRIYDCVSKHCKEFGGMHVEYDGVPCSNPLVVDQHILFPKNTKVVRVC